MSTLTPKLKLIQPELSDNGRQTIQDLATNMAILDEAAEIYSDAIPRSGYWRKNKKVYFNNPQVGGHVGVVNLREGQAAYAWEAIRSYSVGDTVLSTTNNGHYYTCTQSGYSAPAEPNWLIASNSITEDTKNKKTWQAQFAYKLYDIVVPTIPNDRFYVCTVAGTSSSREPNWSTTNGNATSDGQVIWMTYKIVKWKESGISANFRPFGKIE